MITNREIRSEALLRSAVNEVAESALANGIDAARVASVLRERAAAVEDETATDDAEDG